MAALENSRLIWFVGNVGRVLVSHDDTEGRMSVVETRGTRGQMPPLHVHHTDDEVFHVIEGELTVYRGAEVARLGAGDTALAPRGLPHTYRIESETARWIVVGSP